MKTNEAIQRIDNDKWEWDGYAAFDNIGQRPATCENRYCGKDAAVIVEDENSYSWCCNECAPLVPNGKTVWPNGEMSAMSDMMDWNDERQRMERVRKQQMARSLAAPHGSPAPICLCFHDWGELCAAPATHQVYCPTSEHKLPVCKNCAHRYRRKPFTVTALENADSSDLREQPKT